jgi:hypothetical protein
VDVVGCGTSSGSPSAQRTLHCVPVPRRTPAASRSQPPNLNAAVGAAVSGAGKVAGAVGSIAVAGAKQLLKGVMQQPGAQVRGGTVWLRPEAATWQAVAVCGSVFV